MMSTVVLRKPLTLPLTVVFAVFGVAATLLLLPSTADYPALANAALADLLVTGPVLFLIFAYLRNLPLIFVVPIASIGLELSLLTAPPHLHHAVFTAMWITYPLLCLVVLRATYLTVRQLRLAYPMAANITDTHDRLHALLRRALNNSRAAPAMASDLSFLHYAIAPPKYQQSGPGVFSSHGQSGLIPLLWAIGAIVILETVVLHILVHLASPVLAWVLTGVSLYSLMSLVAHIRALPRRCSSLGAHGVTFRSGLFGQCHVPYGHIANVTPTSMGDTLPADTWQLGLLGSMEPHNLLISLHQPTAVEITHGLSRKTRHIAIHMDNPKGFADAIARLRDQDRP